MPLTSKLPEAHRHTFISLVGADGVLTLENDLAHYGRDWLRDFPARPSLVLLPREQAQVQAIVKFCFEERIPLVPSGGRTGLSGGATAPAGEVILSLERLNRIIEVDSAAALITCEAGVVTEKLQDAVAAHGLFLPIDLASKGSSQIGGNIATNAGGIHVLRYGNTRDWVVGLKAVTGRGELLELGGKLIKNQTGYDLRSLLIGSEGTLAVIVEATLQLTRKPSELIRAIAALRSIEDAVRLLEKARVNLPFLSAFELFSDESLEMVIEHHRLKRPIASAAPYYALVEIENWGFGASDELQEFLAARVEAAEITDAVVSFSSAQSTELLRYRELIPETIAALHYPHKNDIAVPVSNIAAFLTDLLALVRDQYPEYRAHIFGHLGDGNLHVNILKPEKIPVDAFLTRCKQVDALIFELVKKYRGSISAEHGIGLLKKPFLHISRSEAEIDLMRAIKDVFDPHRILNPGKIFDARN